MSWAGRAGRASKTCSVHTFWVIWEHRPSLTQEEQGPRLGRQRPLLFSPASLHCPTTGHWVPGREKDSLLIFLFLLKTTWS